MNNDTIQKRYLEDMTSDDLLAMFSEQDEQTWFKHKDTTVFFKNIGNYLTVYDVEDSEKPFPINENFGSLIKSHYGELDRFFGDFKGYENLISREIVFIDDCSTNTITLREVERIIR